MKSINLIDLSTASSAVAIEIHTCWPSIFIEQSSFIFIWSVLFSNGFHIVNWNELHFSFRLFILDNDNSLHILRLFWCFFFKCRIFIQFHFKWIAFAIDLSIGIATQVNGKIIQFHCEKLERKRRKKHHQSPRLAWSLSCMIVSIQQYKECVYVYNMRWNVSHLFKIYWEKWMLTLEYSNRWMNQRLSRARKLYNFQQCKWAKLSFGPQFLSLSFCLVLFVPR